MVNQAVAGRTEELVKEREAQKQAYKERDEARKEKGEVLKGYPKRYFQVPEKKFYISFLHPYEYGLDLMVHNVYVPSDSPDRKGRFVGKLCSKTYSKIDPDYEDCEICNTKIDGRKQFPTELRAFVGYVHTFEGERFTPDESKPEVSYAVSPLRIIEVRFGKGQVIINELVEDVRNGLFQKRIFRQEKKGSKKDTQYLPLKAIHPDDLGPQFAARVPQDILDAYANKSQDDIAREILVNFENVLWDKWEVEPPKKQTGEVVQSETSDQEPEAPVRQKTSSKKALS